MPRRYGQVTVSYASKPSTANLVVAPIEEVAPNCVSFTLVSFILRYFPFSCDNHDNHFAHYTDKFNTKNAHDGLIITLKHG